MLHRMTRWYPLAPVDESFFDTAPFVYRYPVDLSVPPERVWESLTSERSVAEWGMGVRSLEWLTPRPFGVGTRRQVTLPLGAMAVREHFFLWEEGKRYAFYVQEANRSLMLRFAEDYVIEATPDGSRFTWTIALEPRSALRPVLTLGGPLNRLAFGQMASAARKYFATHP